MSTLREAVEYCAEAVSPGRCPFNACGRLDEETVREVNAAGRLLSRQDDWAGLLQNVTLCTVNHRIVLPEFASALRGAKIGDCHKEIRSPYYFHARSAGGPDPTSHQYGMPNNVVDEGYFVLQSDLDCPTRLAVLFSEGNAGECTEVTIAGYNSSRAPVRETLTAHVGGALVLTTNEYSEVTSVTKASTASGLLRIMPFDVGEKSYEPAVLTMYPWEVTARYRRYHVLGLPSGEESEVLGLVKVSWTRDYTSAEEMLPLDNLFALRTAVQAVKSLGLGDRRAFQDYMEIATGDLKTEKEDTQRGQVREVDIRLASRFSAPRLRQFGRSRRGVWR